MCADSYVLGMLIIVIIAVYLLGRDFAPYNKILTVIKINYCHSSSRLLCIFLYVFLWFVSVDNYSYYFMPTYNNIVNIAKEINDNGLICFGLVYM